MKFTSTIKLTITSFIIGIILYAYQKEWVIIIPPTQNISYPTKDTNHNIEHRKITLFFFKHNAWQKEQMNTIWLSDITQNIKTITNNWLILLEDEKIIDKDIQVVSAVISPAKELFLSFNKEPFHKQDSTYTKLMIIQSLLTTMHENKIPVQSIRFLIHHQPLIDDHLNFSISWPISNFLTEH